MRERFEEQRLLGREMPVDGGLRHASRARDVVHLHGIVGGTQEQAGGRVQDTAAAVAEALAKALAAGVGAGGDVGHAGGRIELMSFVARDRTVPAGAQGPHAAVWCRLPGSMAAVHGP